MKAKKRSGRFLLGGFVGAVAASLFWGMARQGGGVISGVGNSANRIYIDPVRDHLAAAIAAHPNTETVSDELLAETVAAIRQRAREGELQAALVLFRIAEIQRAKSG